MNQEKEKQYREEFEKEFPHLNFAKINGEYEFTVTKRDWDYYLTGRKKGDAEIEKLKRQNDYIESMFANSSESYSTQVARDSLYFQDQCKQLKEQLKREAECVDFYAHMSNWQGEDVNGWNSTNVICESDQDDKLKGVWEKGAFYPEEDEYENVGGKRARETQAQKGGFVINKLMTNEAFEEWFDGYDFELLEKMHPEYHKEYYCRVGYFLHQDHIEKLEQEISQKDEEIKYWKGEHVDHSEELFNALKEIVRLKAEIKSMATSYIELMNDRANTIEQLKGELRPERALVDDIVLMSEHAPWCRGKYDSFVNECSCMNLAHYNIKNLTKVARSVQAQRKVL